MWIFMNELYRRFGISYGRLLIVSDKDTEEIKSSHTLVFSSCTTGCNQRCILKWEITFTHLVFLLIAITCVSISITWLSSLHRWRGMGPRIQWREKCIWITWGFSVRLISGKPLLYHLFKFIIIHKLLWTCQKISNAYRQFPLNKRQSKNQ